MHTYASFFNHLFCYLHEYFAEFFYILITIVQVNKFASAYHIFNELILKHAAVPSSLIIYIKE